MNSIITNVYDSQYGGQCVHTDKNKNIVHTVIQVKPDIMSFVFV